MSGSKNPSDGRAEEDSDEEQPTDGGDSIADFLSQFSGGAHQFMITRSEPRQVVVRGQTKRISGHLTTLTTPPTLDDLREQWGGGIYEIRVNHRTAKGPRFVTCRRVEIAGDPKLPLDETPAEPAPTIPAAAPADSPALVQQILEHTFEDKRRVEERFERERQRVLAERMQAQPTSDPSLLQTTLGAIERSQREQIETLRQQLDRRDRDMAELRQQMEAARGKASPLENPEVLKVLFTRGSEDAARAIDQHRHELQLEHDRHQREIEAERERRERVAQDALRSAEQHRQELQLERERHERDVAAERERHNRELADAQNRQERAAQDAVRATDHHRQQLEAERDRHQRELLAERERRESEVATERRDREQQIALIERLHRSEVESLRTSHAQLVATKDEHLGRLTEETRTLRTASRPPDALSDLERVGKVVSAVRNFAPGLAGDGGEAPSGWERLFDHARPLIEKVADNLSKPAPVQVFPPVVPAMSRPNLLPVRRTQQVIRPQFRRPPPTSAPAPSSAPPTGTLTTPQTEEGESAAVAPTTIAEGLDFLEAAFKGERPVDEVSRTAASLFPKAYLRALAQAGPEIVVGEIEKRSPDSLLASSGGKRYLRDLIEALKPHLNTAG